MNEQKLGRKVCRLGEMRKQPMLLPQKLVLGNNTVKPKHTGMPLGAPLGGVLKELPTKITFPVLGSNAPCEA